MDNVQNDEGTANVSNTITNAYAELSKPEYDKCDVLNFLYHLGESFSPLSESTSLLSSNHRRASTTNYDNEIEMERDPRETVLQELFCQSKKKSSVNKDVVIRHQYTLPSRRCGTIYDKLTYSEHTHKSFVPPPPEIWFRSLGGSEDYTNGTLHFPVRMPKGAEELRSYTIRRQKMSFAQLIYLAAQIELDRQHNIMTESFVCDSTVEYVANILSGKNSLDSKQYTPRKISLSQTKELLHAWVLVYVNQKQEYLEVLQYYLYAGYIVTITKKCGGTHEK